jgi:tRNA pseudouridine55 synthase
MADAIKGFLNINKPPRLTSHDVVARVRRTVGRKSKVGHAGTLDPAATGVLPVAIGQATRLIEYLAEARKGYRAVVALGVATTTDDAEGEPLAQRPVPPLDAAAIEAALAPLRGTIQQVPPMYSAIHHQGQRLYDLARAGQTIEREPRTVTIERLDLVDHSAQQLTLDIACSKGTYIRSVARDLGEALDCGAHLAALERIFVGPFDVAQAVPLDALQEAEALHAHLLPPDVAVAHLPAVALTEEQSHAIRNGRPLRLADVPGEHARAHAPDGSLLALLHRRENVWHPAKVLA